MNENNEMQRCLGRIEGKLEGMIVRLERINGRLDKHGNKIDQIENETTTLKAKASVFGAGASMGIVVLWEIIKNKFFK